MAAKLVSRDDIYLYRTRSDLGKQFLKKISKSSLKCKIKRQYIQISLYQVTSNIALDLSPHLFLLRVEKIHRRRMKSKITLKNR